MTLPSYRTQQESDLAAPLWPGNASEDARASLESTADSLPGYPPTSSAHAFKSHPDAGLTMTRRTGGQIGRNCIYRFTSRFPMESHKAQILGRLAYSKEEAIQITQRCIPFLADFDAERFEFFVPQEMTEAGAQHSSHWLPIMDDVWDTFAVDAPRQIKVQLKEEPKEEQARVVHDRKETAIVSLLILFTFAALVGLIVGLSTFLR